MKRKELFSPGTPCSDDHWIQERGRLEYVDSGLGFSWQSCAQMRVDEKERLEVS